MDDFTDYQEYQSNTSKEKVYHFTIKDLIHLGSLLIGIIGLLTSATVLPVWAYWVMAVYLAIVLVIIFALPTKNLISSIINWFNRSRFAKNKRQELQELSNELNELLGSDTLNTIPNFIKYLSSKIANEVNLLAMLNKDIDQFKVLESWAWSVSDNLKHHEHKLFLRDANQFSRVVFWFSWACEWVRQVLDKTEIRDKIPKVLVQDWNTDINKISDYTSRVKRLMNSINKQYNTSICVTSFQDVKPL